ncbi:hypothetical protein [Bradyrhizobium sp. SZCCHNS2015]|uniref:hypothetical protein n=1 Tax=Bradyrhizobium sp. SZCCHNS2015 TaxID=3057305 RepID=UPI0028ED5060|nr:hypothetical protein [Bradyrhizobium sp. SZCCHNS2015]
MALNVRPLNPSLDEDAARRARIEKIALGILNSTFEALSEDDRQDVLDKLTELLRPIPAPRAGDVLGAIVKVLPLRKQWTVQHLREEVAEKGVSANPKEVYNAIGYLVRKGHMRRIGYGRYLVDGGGVVVASDDFGGPTASQEDAYRVDDC